MIRIVAYDPAWPTLFASEAARISQVLRGLAFRIEHVGSTSVPGLSAKPVIDIQVSVPSLEPAARLHSPLAELGYARVQLGSFDLVYPFFQKPSEWPCTRRIERT